MLFGADDVGPVQAAVRQFLGMADDDEADVRVLAAGVDQGQPQVQGDVFVTLPHGIVADLDHDGPGRENVFGQEGAHLLQGLPAAALPGDRAVARVKERDLPGIIGQPVQDEIARAGFAGPVGKEVADARVEADFPRGVPGRMEDVTAAPHPGEAQELLPGVEPEDRAQAGVDAAHGHDVVLEALAEVGSGFPGCRHARHRR